MHCKRKEGKNLTIYSGLWEASWLMLSSPDLVVRVWVLASIVFFLGQARHFTLTVPLSTQSYKWFQGGVEILLVASCYRNQNKLQPDEPLGLKLCRLHHFKFTSFTTVTKPLAILKLHEQLECVSDTPNS